MTIHKLLLAYFVIFSSTLSSQPLKSLTSGEIELGLRKLNVVGSVLYVAAHPDDENTRLLAYLANGQLLRTSYLSMTRGDGGQNLIGQEIREQLGVIRTQELLAARRIDGAEQYFTRANDFGFSKNPEETFKIWDKDKVLSDVVWIIRKLRPDVIITRFPQTGAGGHGHHTASALLAEEAFYAAADLKKFPEQLKYVQPWKAKRLYWNAWMVENGLKLDVGLYNPLLGRSFTEIAGESRSMHKSQGFGAAKTRGSTIEFLSYEAGDSASASIFEGIDFTWNRVKGSDSFRKLIDEAISTFDASSPSKSIPTLVKAYKTIEEIKDDYWRELKKQELKKLIIACCGIYYETLTKDNQAVPGDNISLTTEVINRSEVPVIIKSVKIPSSHTDSLINKPLSNNTTTSIVSEIKIPESISYSQPY